MSFESLQRIPADAIRAERPESILKKDGVKLRNIVLESGWDPQNPRGVLLYANDTPEVTVINPDESAISTISSSVIIQARPATREESRYVIVDRFRTTQTYINTGDVDKRYATQRERTEVTLDSKGRILEVAAGTSVAYGNKPVSPKGLGEEFAVLTDPEDKVAALTRILQYFPPR